MKAISILGLLLAFAAGGWGQASPAAQAPAVIAQTGAPAAVAQAQNPATMPQTQSKTTEVLSSTGPVIADYGKNAYSVNNPEGRIAREVRHELLMLPYYSLFDDLEYSVQGNTVTLNGEVTSGDAVTRNDAEKSVQRIEGVANVINHIKVLPPSPMDQEARERVYRKLVSTAALSQYFWEAAPSIHIIVDNLHVTLKGIVNREGDKDMAGITANQVPGILQVKNELRVVK